MKNPNLNRYGTATTLTRLYRLLGDGKSRTIAQAAAELRITDAPVYSAAKKLRDAGDVHICRWDMSVVNGRFISVWSIGKKPDVAKPKRDAWKRPACDEEEHAKRVAAELARPAFRDPFIAALFGPYEART